MTKSVLRIALSALVICIHSILLASCSTITEETQKAREMDVKVTLDDPKNPGRISFVLYRTPYASEQDPRLDMGERIRLGMRKFAGEQLAERGLCPHGFSGPDIVLAHPNDRRMVTFHVICLPKP
jgi:hypothetical protein